MKKTAMLLLSVLSAIGTVLAICVIAETICEYAASCRCDHE